MMWHDGGAGWGAGWGGWLVMILVMLAVWTLVVGAVVLLVRSLRTPDRSATPTTQAGPPVPPSVADALAILDARLARGEITVEDYQQVRTVLSQR